MQCLFEKEWWMATGTRVIKTVAEVALSMLTVGQLFFEIDWMSVGSVSLTAGIIAFLTCLAGLPEVKRAKEVLDIDDIGMDVE